MDLEREKPRQRERTDSYFKKRIALKDKGTYSGYIFTKCKNIMPKGKGKRNMKRKEKKRKEKKVTSKP